MALLITKLFKNKVILFVLTRYLTYFIQFIVSLLVAVKLGPSYFGIWGFLLLFLNYLQLVNFGISHSMNVILVHHKDDNLKINQYILTALALTLLLSLLIVLFAIFQFFFSIPIFDKYQSGLLVYLVCIIGITSHFNNLFMVIYRVNNRLKEISFYQSITTLLTFIAIFISTNRNLLLFLLCSYILGHALSLIVFIKNRSFSLIIKPSLVLAKNILTKGFFLFIYNLSFYFIVVVTRSIISYYFSVEEFGLFSFSFNMSSAVLLFLEAFSFILLPKVLDKLSTKDSTAIKHNLSYLRKNYLVFAQGVMHFALVLFPLFLIFLPKYISALSLLQLTTITLLTYTYGEGYGAYLMSQNKEKLIALLALLASLVNLSLALIFVNLLHLKFNYIILSSLISYIIFVYSIVFYSRKLLGYSNDFLNSFLEAFPTRLFLPYILSIFFIIFNLNYSPIIVLLIFLVLNYKALIGLIQTFLRVIHKPELINI